MSSPVGGSDAVYPAPPYYPPGYGQPYYPGHQGYPPYAPAPQAPKPGIIPLRPLTLSEIFNGAVAYIRLNPKAALGMTAIVVIVGQVLGIALQISPLAALGAMTPETFDSTTSAAGDSAGIGLLFSALGGAATTAIAAIVLSGLLTVVVGRAVFGAQITVGEAWRRARGRLLPLFGLTALQVLAIALLAVGGVALAVGAGYVAGDVAAVIVGLGTLLVVIVAIAYLTTVLLFAPAVIVLERKGIVAAVKRSFALVRNDFWRVFGISILATLVAGMISGAVSAPFSIVGQVMLVMGPTTTTIVVAMVLIGVGGAIGQIITAPFSAGVVVLLYTDRRMRAEAFDLVLHGGAMHSAATEPEATDQLWLTARA